MGAAVYKCPNCGAHVTFDAQSQKGKCDYCLSTFSIQELEDYLKKEDDRSGEYSEEQISDELRDEINNNTRVYKCPRCGAEVVADKSTAATFCYYCHGPVILTDKLSGDFKPSKVIPFKIDKRKAEEILLNWSKKKWFIPKEFTSAKQLEKITGIYIPYWLFDCDVDGSMMAIGKKIMTWRQGDYEYTKTDTYEVYREAKLKFDNVPHNASSKADDKVMTAIEPFDYNEIKDFSMAYLPGFLADKYDRTKEDVLPSIKSTINNSVNNILRNSINGYSIVSERSFNSKYSNAKFKYALFPVWMLTYQFNNKNYIFAINGQSGEVYGALPVSKGRIGILFTILFVISFIVALIGGMLI